jgi:hypothetical protein
VTDWGRVVARRRRNDPTIAQSDLDQQRLSSSRIDVMISNRLAICWKKRQDSQESSGKVDPGECGGSH